jgi:hypothetical protein
MDQLLLGIADDWQSIQDVGERLARAKRAGASWRVLAYRTGIPMTTVRRWAAPFLLHQPTESVSIAQRSSEPAVTPPRTAAGSGFPTTSR